MFQAYWWRGSPRPWNIIDSLGWSFFKLAESRLDETEKVMDLQEKIKVLENQSHQNEVYLLDVPLARLMKRKAYGLMAEQLEEKPLWSDRWRFWMLQWNWNLLKNGVSACLQGGKEGSSEDWQL